MLKSLFATALLFTAVSFAPAFAEDAKLPRTISLTGHGESHAIPDLVIINIGVSTNAPTAKKALAENTKSMVELMTVLKAANIEAKDIMTSNFNVSARYVDNSSSGKIASVGGYDVTNSVSVTVRKIELLGDILDQAVSSGSNQINGISFIVSESESALNEARKEAVNDAKRKAELYAKAASVSLGNIISISENGGGYQAPMAMQANMDVMRKSVPISQGEQVIASDVNIVWEIK